MPKAYWPNGVPGGWSIQSVDVRRENVMATETNQPRPSLHVSMPITSLSLAFCWGEMGGNSSVIELTIVPVHIMCMCM